MGHLGELRNRLLLCMAGWIVGSVAAWEWAPQLIAMLRGLAGTQVQMVFLRPTEAFFVYFKIAIMGGLFLALPWMLWQVAAFVLPGLEANERRWVYRIVPAATILFVLGSLFAYFVLLPTTLKFFLDFQGYFNDPNIKTMMSVSEYIGFVMFMIVMCGLVFELPIVIVVLAIAGVVSSKLLASGWRYAVLGIFIVAAIITPTPDAFTQTVVALPMIGLYVISIYVVKAIGR